MMVIESIKNIKSGKRELRQFGITIGIVLGLLGGLFFLRQKDYYPCFIVLSFAFLFFGLVAPKLLKPVQKIWMSLATIIGRIITRVILVILFYLVVTPIALLAKLFAKDFLAIKLDKNADSYWIGIKTTGFNKRSYENQF